MLHFCRNHVWILCLLEQSDVIRNEISRLKVNQVLLQLSDAKFGVWRKLARRYEKTYWPGYLEQICLFVLGHQLMYNLGQFKITGSLCQALKSRCGSLNSFYRNQNDYRGEAFIECVLYEDSTQQFNFYNFVVCILHIWKEAQNKQTSYSMPGSG